VEEAQVIVNGGFTVSFSTATTGCAFFAGYSAGLEVFGDFQVYGVVFSGSATNGLIYLQDYSSLIIHGDTWFGDIQYQGVSGVVGMAN